MTPPKERSAEARIRKAIGSLDLDALASEQKTEVVRLRVGPSEKAAIQDAANTLGLTVSEYLLALHRELWKQVVE